MIVATALDFVYPGAPFQLSTAPFSVARGEAVAIVGPSGSGKSTLLSLLSGTLVPQGGSVTVDGVELSAQNEPARRAFRLARIGQVFQRVELLEYLSLEENILLPLRLADMRLAPAHRSRAAGLLARVGLADKTKRKPGTLSQGERQRAGICRALIAAPPLVLADEPTSSLDGASAGPVLDLFFQLVKEEGATLVCLTHDRAILPRFGRVMAMEELGRRP